MSDVKKEIELYNPMCDWLESNLKDRYKRSSCEIHVIDSHALVLDKILTKYNVIDYFPQTVGLDIQIDVLGIVVFENKKPELHFIEAKKTALNLHDLGQLWAYCKLCDPADAYLLSSAGKGSLSKVLENLHREDLLDFGNGKTIKKMKIGKWDVDRKTIDYLSLVPRM